MDEREVSRKGGREGKGRAELTVFARSLELLSQMTKVSTRRRDEGECAYSISSLHQALELLQQGRLVCREKKEGRQEVSYAVDLAPSSVVCYSPGWLGSILFLFPRAFAEG